MKYMEKGGFQSQPLMRLTLGFTLLFFIGLWITNFFFYFTKMGLTPSSVIQYFHGSETNFIPARTFQSMLELTHFHLPIMAVVILLLTHLIIFAPISDKIKVTIISSAFLSAFLGEASSWLVRFISPHFAILKIACFLIFQSVLFILILGLGLYISFPPKGKRASQKE